MKYKLCSEWVAKMLRPTYLFEMEQDSIKFNGTIITKNNAIEYIIKLNKQKESKTNNIKNAYYNFTPFENYSSLLWKKTNHLTQSINALVVGNGGSKRLELDYNKNISVHTECKTQNYLQYLTLGQKVKIMIEKREPKELTRKEIIKILPKVKKEKLEEIIKNHENEIKQKAILIYCVGIEM
ncbi:hypothetical protein [Polaribacter sp. IC063]|nr:hypothetical protein [Polaribacter sp. IC063]TXD53632.1 hypothetical protein ES043_03140 [Polaribacter sp. IC063]